MTGAKPKAGLHWWNLFLIFTITALIIGFVLWLKPKPETHTIYAVRHAEKLTGPDTGHNPALSDAGIARVQMLTNMLKDKGVTHIHSSDYIRTTETAKPLANILGLSIEIYDPRDLPALAENIKAMPGVHLVVGHSNTTREIVTALGGNGGTPIEEKSEYDRLYIVNINTDGTVISELQRYGPNSENKLDK